MNIAHSAAIVAAAVLVTACLRFAPFVIFGGSRKTPEVVRYLGGVLQYSIMGMLVVYCLRNVSVTAFPFALPEFIACAAVVLLHLWKRNTLLSIVAGTVIYMVLIQTVFA